MLMFIFYIPDKDDPKTIGDIQHLTILIKWSPSILSADLYPSRINMQVQSRTVRAIPEFNTL